MECRSPKKKYAEDLQNDNIYEDSEVKKEVPNHVDTNQKLNTF
jgi:hypothetical protein